MNKSLLWSALALAAFAATSCSQEDPVYTGSGDTTTFTIQLPDNLGTRAASLFYGDGTSANKLNVAIYDADAGTELFSNFDDSQHTEGLEVTDFDPATLTATVNVTLIKSVNYRLIFWAQDSEAQAYTYNSATRSITVDYTAMANFDESRDAFFGAYDFNVGDTNRTFTLYRPFAQINIGTSDYAAYMRAGGVDSFGMTLTNISNSLNLDSGEVSVVNNFDGTVKVAEATANPAKDGQAYTFPVTTAEYSYLAMAYVLVGDNGVRKDNLDVTLNVNNADWYTYPNVPAQWNYRTNIFGALLTNPTEFEVVIDPAWERPDYYVSGPWDGVTVSAPAIDADTKTGTIVSPDQLAWLSQNLAANNNFDGYTFELLSDIDLNSKTWTPIGTDTNPFKGNFNGGGYTISNSTDAIFGAVDGATVSEVNLKDVNVKGTVGAAGLAVAADNSTFNDVKVLSGSVTAQGLAAGVVAQATDCTFQGCSNAATVASTGKTSPGGNYTGGIVGQAIYDTKGCEINDCSNSGAVSGRQYTGGIAGMAGGNVTNCTNDGEVSATYSSLGGIVGEVRNVGNVTGCVNNADILNNNPEGGAYGVGGIIGWTRAYGNFLSPIPSYAVPPTISDCTNNGKTLTGGTGVGGIVGIMYNNGTVDGCKNYATQLTAKGSFVAGIVGGQQSSSSNEYPGYKGAANYLITVKNCTTTTTLDQMSKNCAALLIYINSNSQVALENNTPSTNS